MDIEHLGQPCRARNILAARVVTDRSSGREWLVLSNMNEMSGAELIFLDFERDTAQVVRAPAGAGAWALNEVSKDRLVMGTFYDGRFMVFDLNAMKFVKTADFPGETYIWDLAIGSDGRVYGGTFPGGKLGALDLNTYTVEDCGAPAPPSRYLRNVSATPEGLILCSLAYGNPALLLYDPRTKRFEPAPDSMKGVTAGISWNGYFLAGSRAYEGRSLDVADPPPYPTPPESGEWEVDTGLTTDKALFLRQGNKLYRYEKGDKTLTLMCDLDPRAGRVVGCSKKGELLGLRGQDYFVIREGDRTPDLRRIPGESYPRTVMFLRADDRDRLWGGPTFGQTLFWMDARTGKSVNTGAICDSGGEVYDAAFHGGCVYAAAYAGGNVVRYDPDQPWDQWNQKNPRTIAGLRSKGYIRPTGGIVFGADGRLYSGWMAQYGTYGGAVAITDPETGDTDLIENPLGEQAVTGLAVDDRFIYIGTSLRGNGLPQKNDEAVHFGVIECAARKVVFQHAFKGASGVHPVAYDAKTRQVAMAVDGRLHVFDTRRREFVTELPADLPPVTSDSISVREGRLFYGNAKSIVEVDLGSRSFRQIARAPADVGNVTMGPDGTLYFSCGADVYAVRGPAHMRRLRVSNVSDVCPNGF